MYSVSGAEAVVSGQAYLSDEPRRRRLGLRRRERLCPRGPRRAAHRRATAAWPDSRRARMPSPWAGPPLRCAPERGQARLCTSPLSARTGTFSNSASRRFTSLASPSAGDSLIVHPSSCGVATATRAPTSTTNTAAQPLRRIGGSFRAYGLHGVGSHFFAPSASFLKCVLVTNSCARYFGSETTVVTTSHSSPSGTAKRSKYSVIIAPSL